MYIPRSYEEKRIPVLHELIVSQPFASLITWGSSGLFASHIPMVLEQDGSEFGVLKGHISRANTQARDLVSNVDALAIFSGDHQYISGARPPRGQRWSSETKHTGKPGHEGPRRPPVASHDFKARLASARIPRT